MPLSDNFATFFLIQDIKQLVKIRFKLFRNAMKSVENWQFQQKWVMINRENEKQTKGS